MPTLMKTFGFSPESLGTLQVAGTTEPIESSQSIPALGFGTGQVVAINGQEPTVHLSVLSTLAATVPLSNALYFGAPDAAAHFGFLRPCQLKNILPPADQLPPLVLQAVMAFHGGPIGASPLQGLIAEPQIKKMNFASNEAWKAYADKMKDFLGKFGLNTPDLANLLEKLSMVVVSNPSGWDYCLDQSAFFAGVTMPIDLTESAILNEALYTYEGGTTPPPNGTPGNLIFWGLKGAHLVLIRKAAKGIHMTFVFSLKTKPSFAGFLLRHETIVQPSTAFETVDPNALAKLVTSNQSPPSMESSPPAGVGAVAPPVDPQTEELRKQLQQLEILNQIYMHSNKILGEEIKRLVRQRKEPSTDEELRYARTQLEIKIKKLLVRLTQYDTSLRETAQQIATLKEQINKAMEEKKAADEKINELEEELIQARTGA